MLVKNTNKGAGFQNFIGIFKLDCIAKLDLTHVAAFIELKVFQSLQRLKMVNGRNADLSVPSGRNAALRPCWCSSPTSALPDELSLQIYFQLQIEITMDYRVSRCVGLLVKNTNKGAGFQNFIGSLKLDCISNSV